MQLVEQCVILLVKQTRTLSMEQQQGIAQTLKRAGEMCARANSKEDLIRILNVVDQIVLWTRDRVTQTEEFDVGKIWNNIQEHSE